MVIASVILYFTGWIFYYIGVTNPLIILLLFKLFFRFDFSYESSNFMFENRIILIRFCVLFIAY